MRKLLKYLSISLLIIISNTNLFAQWCTTPNFVPPTGGNRSQSVLESRYGETLPTKGTLRILLVFFEVNYDVGTDPAPTSTDWLPHTLPSWATPINLLVDANTPTGPTQALFTEYFREASSGQYNVLGDYLLSPTNGGIFSINYSVYLNFSSWLDNVNTAMGGNFVTGTGLNNVTNFDNWTKTFPGEPKITPSTDSPHKYDHVMFIFRNLAGLNGGGQASDRGFGGLLQLVGFGADSFTFFGVNHYSGQLPFAIARHEFSHLLYGDNRFHCGGGGYGTPDNYWIPIEGGWSNLGLYNSSLQTWNAWDRQRMDWKASGNSYNPAARNAGNTAEVNGDLDATIAAQAGTYTLRDFVTTGDAIRIKLPFTDPASEYPEWIWIENHNGIAMNNSPFDRWQYQGYGCVNPAVYGLYMYMQIDKDTRQAATFDDLYGGNAGYSDYLRPITAEGRYDREFLSLVPNTCHFWIGDYPIIRSKPNALTGDGDQDWFANNWIPGDGILNGGDRKDPYMENVAGNNVPGLLVLGDSRQAFTYSGNKKLGIGTNPSSASLMNMVGDNVPLAAAKNLQKVYLNGISITILNQATTGEIQVQIKFDDVDVDNDTRWCADTIILNPITTPSGYSLNILSGKTITLDQGTTATRMDNPKIINNKEVFASPTVMQCLPNTFVHLESNSNLIVDNSSTLLLNPTSKIEIASGAILRVKRGGKLILEGNATINVLNGGRIIIEDDGSMDYFPNAIIKLNGSNSVLEINGMLNIKDNATFTFTYPPSGTQHGYLLFANTSLIPSRNITAGNNCNINLYGGSQNLKMLQINQETFYSPSNLINFTLSTGKIELANNARLQIDGLTTYVNLLNAKFTSTTSAVNNGHRGVSLLSQKNVFITNCVFEYGSIGINAFLTTGVNSLLNISNSYFQNNRNGLLINDKGCNLDNCFFLNNEFGFIGSFMSLPSTCIGCTFTGNTGLGCYWLSYSNASLTIRNSDINQNSTGVKVHGAPLNIRCSNILNNKIGINVLNGATLTMNNLSKVIATGNKYTIKPWQANGINLTNGNNDLTPSGLNNQSVISGRVLSGHSVPPPTANKWNALGNFSSNDYLIFDNNSINVTINDAIPQASALACGIDPCPIQPCGEPCMDPPCEVLAEDALLNCPDCQRINTADFTNKKLNEATGIAIEKLKSSESQNFRKSIKLFSQILDLNIPNPNKRESYLLNLNYLKLQESLGFAFSSKQLNNSKVLSVEVQKIIKIQDKYIDIANQQDNYIRKFLYTMDKAQTYRIANRRDLSLKVLNDILPWVKVEEAEEVNNLICTINLENDALEGRIDLGTIAERINQCNHTKHFKLTEQLKDVPVAAISETVISVFPNPINDIANIRTNIENARIILFDNVGRSIKDEKINFDSDIDLSTFSRGIYILKIENLDTFETHIKKLVVQ